MNGDTQSGKAIGTVVGISSAILVFLFWLIYFKTPGHSESDWISNLPTVFTSFNAVSACCLLVGFMAIKRGIKRLHIAMMISATMSSGMFLILYVIYSNYHGDSKFLGEGIIRPFYFFILISHIFLSVAVVPLILLTLWFAIKKQYHKHKRIARWTFPIWMYVSVTGVLVYLILHNFNTV
jgi:putative membrane protein